MKKKFCLMAVALAGLMMYGVSAEMVYAKSAESVQNKTTYPEQMMSNPVNIVKQLMNLRTSGDEIGIIHLASMAIQRYPNEVIFYQLRSNAYVKLHQVDEGVKDMETAVQLDPEQPDNYLVRGMLYGIQHKFEKAFADYDKARNLSKIQEDQAELIRNINQMEINDMDLYIQDLLHQKKWDDADAVADRAIRQNPENPKAYELKANVQAARSDKKNELKYKYYAIAIGKENSGEYEAAAAYFGRLGETERAVQSLGKAIEKDPNNADAYSLRGLVYADAVEYDKAVADYTKAIKLAPNAERYNNRGEIYRRMKQYDKAQADLDKAYSLDPYYVPLWDTMGNLALERGQLKKAVEWLTKAIEKEPYSESFVSRAKAYRALGRDDLAAEDEKEAAEWREKEDKSGIVH